jgi:hypothetical protein
MEQFGWRPLAIGQFGCDRRGALHPVIAKRTDRQYQAQTMMIVPEVAKATDEIHVSPRRHGDASGDSGLQNLGDGYYQFNWKTPKIYANSCKTLRLSLGEGSGFEHTALFKFIK